MVLNHSPIYIDTNVCRDCVKGRNNNTIHLMGIIKDKNLQCFTSIFTLMEFTDTEKDSIFFNKKIRIGEDVNKILRLKAQKDLNIEDLQEAEKVVKSFFEHYPFVQFANLDGNAWNLALKISSTSNLSASDIIHLATAWQSNCSAIVTSDEFFKKEGTKILKKEKVSEKLKIYKPEEFLKILNSKHKR